MKKKYSITRQDISPYVSSYAEQMGEIEYMLTNDKRFNQVIGSFQKQFNKENKHKEKLKHQVFNNIGSRRHTQVS